MLGKAIQPEIEEMIQHRQFDELRETLGELEIADIAEIIADLPPEDQAVVFRILPRDLAHEVFEYLPVEDEEALLKNLSTEAVGDILNAMSPDDRTRLLEELPGPVTQRLLKVLNPAELRVARTLLGYPEESIGRLMTPEYVAARPDWTVQHTLEHIRKSGSEAETISYIYITDEKGHLIDDLHLAKLVLADPETKLRDLIEENFVALSALDDREQAVIAFKKYDRIALPVVDSSGVLLGIVTVDDVMDVEEEEATEDVQKFGGVEALDAPYLEVDLLSLVRKRGGWLSILFVGEMLTTSAMGYFEHAIARAAFLAFFIPLIISSGGNSGSQASTLVIRAMALGEIRLRDWWRVVWRELVMGLSLGTVLGVLGFIRVVVLPIQDEQLKENAFAFGFTIMVSLIGVVMFGTFAGSMLPFLLRRVGLDPASASAPMVATLVDVMGIVIYFSVASLLLAHILG